MAGRPCSTALFFCHNGVSGFVDLIDGFLHHQCQSVPSSLPPSFVFIVYLFCRVTQIKIFGFAIVVTLVP